MGQFSSPVTVGEGLDALVAMMLVAGRLHVEGIYMVAPGLARLDLSGEAIDRGVQSLAQYFSAPEVPPDPGSGESAAGQAQDGGSLWQAIRDFALPPPPRQAKRR